jgi:hypothetical protein
MKLDYGTGEVVVVATNDYRLPQYDDLKESDEIYKKT